MKRILTLCGLTSWCGPRAPAGYFTSIIELCCQINWDILFILSFNFCVFWSYFSSRIIQLFCSHSNAHMIGDFYGCWGLFLLTARLYRGHKSYFVLKLIFLSCTGASSILVCNSGMRRVFIFSFFFFRQIVFVEKISSNHH